MVTAIVGANWGDEGKGKLTDMLSEESDIIVRFQGGSNAGHTIVNEYGKFALHILPSGVFYRHTTNIIGNGVALNIPDLFKEINGIVERGVPTPNIKVSDRAQIVMPYHILFDEYEEERLAGKSFGSTKSGIAPFYSDKYAKVGIQVSELFDEEALREKLEGICIQKNTLLEHLYHKPALDVEELMSTLQKYREMVEPYVCDVSAFLYEAKEQGKQILLEGQLGSLKDPDHGIYPMVTSSSTLAGYGAVGAGVPPYEIKRIVAVVKAYSSAVGAGEFVSEIFGEEADELRRRGGDGGEYGATTGRPRRMGWFDAVASRYGCRVQGATEAALTVLDVLGYLEELPVCVGYEIDGKVTKDFPTTTKLKKAKPVYEVLPGWKSDIRGITEYDKLPENCRRYIEFIEKELGVPVKMVSNGPARHEIIKR
ncbi:MAG: adenylosuccinate synthase [Lachnospiraceae bacterium]|nr:adenylosuccinate synthase [Lachnospiraceae bacterium]